MDDLIRRSDVIFPDAQKPDINGELTDFQCGYNTALSKMKTRISNIPAVDAVEVCRCRECWAYGTDSELAKAEYLNPDEYCGLMRCEFPPDGYCSYGRRREAVTHERPFY